MTLFEGFHDGSADLAMLRIVLHYIARSSGGSCAEESINSDIRVTKKTSRNV